MNSLRGPSSPSTSRQELSVNSSHQDSHYEDSGTGAEAIAGRRRQSSSFKELSKGLVSGSRFTQGSTGLGKPPARAGALFATKSPAASGSFSPSNTPQQYRPERKTSNSRKGSGGSSRKVSAENQIVKENAVPRHEKEDSDGWGDDPAIAGGMGITTSHSRASLTNVDLTAQQLNNQSTSPSHLRKPTRSSSLQRSVEPLSPRRTSSSFTAVRENGYVSSSPFKGGGTASSEDLFTPRAKSAPKTGMGLGRPQGPPSARFPTPPTHAPISSTPPRRHQSSSPSSAFSPSKKGGVKGPRAAPITSTPPVKSRYADNGDETETDEHGASLLFSGRTTPGNGKSVSWATTEEVLVFEVDDGLSASTISGSFDSLVNQSHDDGSIVLLDESSVIENVSTDDDGSVISSVDAMMDMVNGAIEETCSPRVSMQNAHAQFLSSSYANEPEAARQFDARVKDLNRTLNANAVPSSVLSPTMVSQYLAMGSPALSERSTADTIDGYTSSSEYGEDEEEILAGARLTKQKAKEMVARAHVVQRGKASEPFRPTLVIPRLESPSTRKMLPAHISRLPASAPIVSIVNPISSSFPSSTYSTALAHPSSAATNAMPYSIPALEENSPFLGFRADEISTIHTPRDYNSTSTFSAPVSSSYVAPLTPRTSQRNSLLATHTSLTKPTTSKLSAGPNDESTLSVLDRSDSIVSRRASILDTSSSSLAVVNSAATSVPNSPTITAPLSPTASLRGPSRLAAGRRDHVERNRRLELGSSVGTTSVYTASPSSSASSPSASRTRAIPARPAANSPAGPNPGVVVARNGIVAQESALDRLSRSVSVVEEEEDEDASVVLGPKIKRRGRSSSTSALDDRVMPLAAAASKNRMSFLDATFDGGDSFSSTMRPQVEQIFRTPGIIEHGTIFVTDSIGPTVTSSAAGDVSPGKAWRRKRESNVHGTKMDSRRKIEIGGKVFVTVTSVSLPGVPIPQSAKTVVNCVVRGAAAPVVLKSVPLAERMIIKAQVELVYSSKLEFDVEVHLNTRAAGNEHLLAPAVPSTPSLKNKSSLSKLKALVSPTKKTKPVPVVLPALLNYVTLNALSGSGVLARGKVVFARDAEDSKCRELTLTLPLTSSNAPSAPSSQTNFLSSAINKPLPSGAQAELRIFYFPALDGISKHEMPQNMLECTEGIKAAKRAARAMKLGELTQIGGDCQNWRMRKMELRGSRLIPYSLITGAAYVEYDMALVTSIVDCNLSSVYDDSDPHRSPLSWILNFKDGTELRYQANSEQMKIEWMEAMKSAMDVVAAKPVPKWALAYVKAVDAKASQRSASAAV